MKSPEISVVVLCYRGGEAIRQSVRKIIEILDREKLDFEIVLVANYDSPDDTTPAIVTDIAAQNPRIRCSAIPKEGMMGWDMRSGLALARGAYVAVIDGDGQMPFEDIARVYKAIIEKRADLAKTYRTSRGDDVWRIVVSYIFNILFMLLFPGLKARDINSKPKIFSRHAFQKLRLTSNDWFIDAEIMIQTRRYGFSIVEIPTVFKKLSGRQSFVKTSTMLEFLRNLMIFRIREF